MIPKNITIIKNETMIEDMEKIGYPDFNEIVVNPFQNEMDPMNYLSENSINLINNYYFMDFLLFDYEMIEV